MIRIYEPADLHACALLYKAAFAGKPWNEDWPPEIAEQRVADLMCTPVSEGYLCEENGVLCGMLLGHRMTYLYGTELLIHELCVSPRCQRQGIGTKLLAHVCDILQKDGCAGIFLNTRRGYPSEKFYLQNGFTHQADTVSLYKALR